jgi:acyl-CoA thioesterase FadM
MRTLSKEMRVGAEQVDAGDHLNWLAQFTIVQEVHFALRDELGLGLDALKSRHGVFLVMGKISEVTFRRQLRLNDPMGVRVTIWAARATCFEFVAEILSAGHVASTMRWTMPLISMATGRLCRIPPWMLDAIGAAKPQDLAGSPVIAAKSESPHAA